MGGKKDNQEVKKKNEFVENKGCSERVNVAFLCFIRTVLSC